MEGYVLACCDHKPTVNSAVCERGMRWLKATNEQLVFVNIEGQSTILAKSCDIPADKPQINLNSLYDATISNDKLINGKKTNFYKFRGTRTVVWSTQNGLFVKFANGEFHQIISV
jgi:hypothetical protein